MGKLMHDFLCSDPDDMHFDILAERSRYFKENPKGVSEMCKAMEDMRNEALERGRIEGRAEGRLNNMIESVRSLKAKLGLNDQQVRDALSISNEDCHQSMTINKRPHYNNVSVKLHCSFRSEALFL